MSLSELAIRRPVFITSLITLLLALGWLALTKLPVDMFPNITFPVAFISTTYPGAGPEEVETLVSKIIEDELNNIPGIKQVSSRSTEGQSQVIVEFTNETDINHAEQQVRDKMSAIKRKLPTEAKDPIIKRLSPADKPILILALQSHLPKVELYELAKKAIQPQLERIHQVGMVEVLGGSDREIHVDLDRNKLLKHNISAMQVVNSITAAGQNAPIGSVDQGNKEKNFRWLGNYNTIKDIGSVIVNFIGNDVPITVSNLGTVTDGTVDEYSKTYVNGHPALTLLIFRQTGSNTIEVVKRVESKLVELNADLAAKHIPVAVQIVRDTSKVIHANVNDVLESILVGIALTIIVVYLFLGSIRSTFITGLALPTSLIGSFLLMHLAGFSINTMSLLALSLAVGLLVDDAIVVRENIFRHHALGKSRRRAALEGTKEVLLAVIATTLTVMAVFGPVGFLHGVVGSFFKEFGLTVCFAMIISFFDAITVAPMLSAYISSPQHQKRPNTIIACSLRLQHALELIYAKILHIALGYPLAILASAFFIFLTSIFAAKYIPTTFVPSQDTGEFVISLKLSPGSNLAATDHLARQIDQQIRTNPETAIVTALVGARGEPNQVEFYVNMVPQEKRTLNTTQFKEKIRTQLKKFKGVKIVVKDVDMVGEGERPFNLTLKGNNLEQLKAFSFQVYDLLRTNKALSDPEISYKPGKPEMQIIPQQAQLQQLGVSSRTLGQELRIQVEGATPAVFRKNDEEYNIRVRLQQDQRDLEHDFNQTCIPNVNNRLIRLADIATPVHSSMPTTINRKDHSRYIQISADIAPNGPGMGGIINEINTLFQDKLKLPEGITYSFDGQAESFQELIHNMLVAVSLGVLFIYLVLASLYESFITPFTIMLVLPLATCGAFYGLLITGHSLDIFSMIGCILLFGIATKNSILLVDYTRMLTAQGMATQDAIIKAGLTRLRPILMTTIALIAGMLPIAIGLNETSKQRTSMGIAVIGGLISSTLLTLVVVPAAYWYMERLRQWSKKIVKRQRMPLPPPKENSSSGIADRL